MVLLLVMLSLDPLLGFALQQCVLLSRIKEDLNVKSIAQQATIHPIRSTFQGPMKFHASVTLIKRDYRY